MIELRVLGSIDLRGQEGQEFVSVLTQPKKLALLVNLDAARPHGFHRRDRLVAMFWPELDASHSRNALSKAIHHLRRSLGEEAIVTRGDEVMVDPAFLRSDVRMLEDALASGAYERALQLYRGPLADGLFVDDAPDFEQWLSTERDRLSHAVANAGWNLAEKARQDGRINDAIASARQAASLMKEDEPSLRRLMSFLESVGDRAGALRVYEEFSAWLKAELDATPAADTEDLHKSIRESVTSHLPPPAAAGLTTESPRVAAAMQPSARQVSAKRKRPSLVRVTTIVSAIAAAVLLTVGLLNSNAESRVVLDPRRVTVRAFENRTGDSAYNSVGVMAADWIGKDVASSGLVTVADARDDPASNSGLVVSGAYYRDGDHLRFQAQLAFASIGTVSRVFIPVTAPLGSPTLAFDSLGLLATSAVAEATDARIATFSRTAPNPPSFAAYREYVEGMDAFGRHDDSTTRMHFLNAYRADTTFTTALLIAAGSTLRLWTGSDSLVSILEARRNSLSHFNQAWLDMFLAGRRADVAELARLAGELSREAPGSYFPYVEATALISIDRPRAALDVLLKVDPTRGWMKGLSDYWYPRCAARHMLGEYAEELSDATIGAHQYPANFAVISCEVRALAALGRAEAVDSSLDAAAGMIEHDTWELGSPYAIAAAEADAHGYPAIAAKARKRTVDWVNALPPDKKSVELPLFGPAWFLYTAGAWPELAERIRGFRKAEPNSCFWIVYEGISAAHDGDRKVAMFADSVLQVIAKPGGDKRYGAMLMPLSLYHRAEIASLLGDRDRAIGLLGDAFANRLRYNTYVHANQAFASIRNDPRYVRLMAPRD